MLGTVESPDGAQLTVADVPGLIEGASEGVGLGHEFLAHLERARLLLHVIDASDDDVEERFRTIDRELALYGAGLDERPQAIVLNKIDLLPEAARFPVEDERVVAVFRVSAATGEGIEELKRTLFTLVPPAPSAPRARRSRSCPSSSSTDPSRPRAAPTGSTAPIAASASSARHRQGEELEAALDGRRSPQGPGGRARRRDARVAVDRSAAQARRSACRAVACPGH